MHSSVSIAARERGGVLTEECDENQDHDTDSTHFDLGLREDLFESSGCMRFELELKLDDNRLWREGAENYIEEGEVRRYNARAQELRSMRGRLAVTYIV
jgi:hypothetical protein